MTAFFQARLQLDERLTPAELAGFETVFSELLDAAATAHLRDGGGDWLIEALFTDPPAKDAVAALLAPIFADCGLTPVTVAITPLAQRDWLADAARWKGGAGVRVGHAPDDRRLPSRCRGDPAS